MAVPLASLTQLGAWLERDLSANTKAEFALGVASSAVRAHTGMSFVDGAGDLIGDLPDAVWQVTVMAASRLFENPRAAVQETTGPFSVSLASSDENAALYLTKAEKSMLDDPTVLGEASRSGLFTIDTTRGDYVDGTTRTVSTGDSYWPDLPTL